MREPPVTLEEVVRIAQAHCPDRTLREVRAYDELETRVSCYGLSEEDLASSWVAYYEPGYFGVGPDFVALISGTGRVLFSGWCGE